MTNQSGKVIDRCTYGTYGEMVSHTGSSDTPFLFDEHNGVMTDGNGLYYMRARYYSPLLMRFINSDPVDGNLKDSRTLNKYAYADGNPISIIDSEGKFAWIAAGAIVGGVFGGGSQILSNITEGKTWYSNVVGATVGGALNGGILAATGGTSLLTMGGAALAGGAAQSIINEAESYVSGERQLDPSNFENSAEDIAANTIKNSAINMVGDYIGGKWYSTKISWWQPKSWKSFLTMSYGQKIMSQTAVGAGISFLESMVEDFRNMNSGMDSNGSYATSTVIK